jgi:hypothetical protein
MVIGTTSSLGPVPLLRKLNTFSINDRDAKKYLNFLMSVSSIK